jgi:hypothetical protein
MDELREQAMQRIKKRMSLRSKVYIHVEGLEQNEDGTFERKEGEKALNLLSFVITDFLGLLESGNYSENVHKEVLMLSGAAGNNYIARHLFKVMLTLL